MLGCFLPILLEEQVVTLVLLHKQTLFPLFYLSGTKRIGFVDFLVHLARFGNVR